MLTFIVLSLPLAVAVVFGTIVVATMRVMLFGNPPITRADGKPLLVRINKSKAANG